MKKKKNRIAPDLLLREKAALLHRHRQVVRFNDRELAALNEYCEAKKITNKSALLRRIIMERVLTDMGENPPTLF